MKTEKQINRRNFIKAAGLLAASAALSKPAKINKLPITKIEKVPRRKLGKTSLELPVISVGTGAGQSPQVLNYAKKNGVNFIHTSVNYAGGKAIRNVAKAIKGQKDKFIIGLKITWAPDDDKAMDKALKILGVDSVDIAFFNIHNANEVKKDKYRKAAEKWKKEGKFKYIGLTTHKQMKECMEVALKQGFYDALMPSYNLTMEKECADVFKQAEKQGVGIILMKTQRQMNKDVYIKSVPKYLATPAVTTINKTLKTFADIDKMITAANAKLSKNVENEIEKIVSLAMVGHCAMCGKCSDNCPQGVAVADIVRCADYYMADSEYFETARETYAEIDTTKCVDCGKCEEVCPNDVPIKHYREKMRKLFV